MSARSYLMTTRVASVTTPSCGPSNPAASHGSQSSDTISLGRSSPVVLQRQRGMAQRALPQPQQTSSSWDSQQHAHGASAFTPYQAQPVTAKHNGASGPKAPYNQHSGDGSSTGSEATALGKLAQLLLSMPEASGQLADLMLALQSGQGAVAQSPLVAVEGSGSSLPAVGSKRPLEAASLGSPQRPSHYQQQQQQCLAAQPPTGGPVDATLQRLALLLTEVPGLSDALAKAMAATLDGEQRQPASPEEPPTKRGRLSSSTATVAGDLAPAARLAQLGLAPPPRSLSLTPLSSEPFASAPATVSPWGMADATSAPALPLRPVARPAAAAAAWGHFLPRPAPVGRPSPSPELPVSLRAAQHHLLLPTAAPVLRPARQPQLHQQVQSEQQYAPQAQRSLYTDTARAAGAEATPSVDRVKLALLLWQVARAREAVQQRLRTRIALARYQLQQEELEQARSY